MPVTGTALIEDEGASGVASEVITFALIFLEWFDHNASSAGKLALFSAVAWCEQTAQLPLSDAIQTVTTLFKSAPVDQPDMSS